MTTYNKVRLIGFAIPTTPASMVAIGDVNGPGSVAGTYPAFADPVQDNAARLDVMESAVEAAFSKIGSATTNEGVLNIFVAPEFYWHSDIGPYVVKPGDEDPAEQILTALQERFPTAKYPNTVFVFGTVISAEVENLDVIFEDSTVQVRNQVVRALGEGWTNSFGPIQGVLFDMLVNFIKMGHSYPKVQVRNRALIVGSELFNGVTGDLSAGAITTEKYFASNEDFLLWDVTGKAVLTEQTVAYPPLDLSGGDFKKDPGDPKAIFNVEGGPTVGVEICLDHSDHRLRHSSQRSPWPTATDGIGLHLVPSCGMQLHPESVAAKAGGLAFNCDGQYALEKADADVVGKGSVGEVDCIYVNYKDAGKGEYGSHTQLTRVVTGPVGANSASASSASATFQIPEVDVTVVPVSRTAEVDAVFAGGPGSVHIYGLDAPLDL